VEGQGKLDEYVVGFAPDVDYVYCEWRGLETSEWEWRDEERLESVMAIRRERLEKEREREREKVEAGKDAKGKNDKKGSVEGGGHGYPGEAARPRPYSFSGARPKAMYQDDDNMFFSFS
jgi:hypothetical protein